MCLGGGGGSNRPPQQSQRDAPEVESAAVTENKNSLKADSSGLPDRPRKEASGWQRAAKNDPNNKYHKGWVNPDGTVITPDWVKGSSHSSKY